MSNTPSVLLLGTCDTKLEELLYVRTQLIETHNVKVELVDVGRTPSSHPAITIAQADILSASHLPESAIASLPRGELVSKLISCTIPVIKKLVSEGTVHGMISLGGSGGSSLANAMPRCSQVGLSLVPITILSLSIGP